MQQRRQGVRIPTDVVNLLVALAERHSMRERCARPGNYVLARDIGAASKDYIRKWLRVAADLGAVTYLAGRGRGRATEVRFTSDVWQAPQLGDLSRMDQVRRAEVAAKGQLREMPLARRTWNTDTKRRRTNAHFEARNGRGAKVERATSG